MNEGARNALDAYIDKLVAKVRANERAKIAEQVRRHCTPPFPAYQRGGDALIAAVADWIENPPEWVPHGAIDAARYRERMGDLESADDEDLAHTPRPVQMGADDAD